MSVPSATEFGATLIARDADCAHEAVPVSDPTNDPVNDPVIGAVRLFSCNELEIVPTGNPDGSTNEAVVALDDDSAHDEVPSNDPVIPWVTLSDPVTMIPLPDTNNDPVITALPLNGNPAPDAALSAYDAVSA